MEPNEIRFKSFKGTKEYVGYIHGIFVHKSKDKSSNRWACKCTKKVSGKSTPLNFDCGKLFCPKCNKTFEITKFYYGEGNSLSKRNIQKMDIKDELNDLINEYKGRIRDIRSFTSDKVKAESEISFTRMMIENIRNFIKKDDYDNIDSRILESFGIENVIDDNLKNIIDFFIKDFDYLDNNPNYYSLDKVIYLKNEYKNYISFLRENQSNFPKIKNFFSDYDDLANKIEKSINAEYENNLKIRIIIDSFFDDLEDFKKNFENIYINFNLIEKFKNKYKDKIDFLRENKTFNKTKIENFLSFYDDDLDKQIEEINKNYEDKRKTKNNEKKKKIISEIELIIDSFCDELDNLKGSYIAANIVENLRNKYKDKIDFLRENKTFNKTKIENFLSFYNHDLDNKIEEMNENYEKKKTIISKIELIIDSFCDELDNLKGSYITVNMVEDLRNKYKNDIDFLRENKTFHKTKIENFLSFFNKIDNEIENINKKYVESELEIHKEYFDTLFKDKKTGNPLPLNDLQRRAVIIDDTNNQIVAGAGTGKTTTMIAKMKYLIEKKGVSPRDISCHSFSRKSVKDLNKKWDEVNGNFGLKISTFHSLGLSILTEDGNNDEVLDEDDSRDLLNEIIIKYLRDILNDPKKPEEIIEYLAYYINENDEKDMDLTLGELSKLRKKKDLQTIKNKIEYDPGKNIGIERVQSSEELLIANFLYLNGIEYEYKKEYSLNNELLGRCDIYYDGYKRRYNKKCISSFYLKDYNIYLDHLGLDGKGKVPWLTKINQKKYLDDLKWKRCIFKNVNDDTIRLETFTWYRNEVLIEKLKEKLKNHKVDFNKKNYQQIYKVLFERHEIEKTLKDLINLIRTFINLFKANNYDLSYFDVWEEENKKEKNIFKKKKHILFLSIIKEIFEKYEKNLHNKLDYNDMINYAVEIVRRKGVKHDYKYLIIDEYQDISYTRNSLIKAIQEKTGAKIIAIGDDWQAIYRFTGSDVILFSHFDRNFPNAKRSMIENTYRNSKQLLDISKKFIMKNKDNQIDKNLFSKINNPKPIKIYNYYSTRGINNERGVFESIIKDILTDFSKKKFSNKSATILARNNKDIHKYIKDDDTVFTKNWDAEGKVESITYKIGENELENMEINYSTVHSAKGLEDENIILINLLDEVDGFPNQIEDDSVLEFVYRNKENFDFPEERRLFYVALTRTKNNVYMMVPHENSSVFIKELLDDSKEYIDIVETGDVSNVSICPSCETGYLLHRKGQRADGTEFEFIGCSIFPTCEYKIHNVNKNFLKKTIICPKCKENFLKEEFKNNRFYVRCLNRKYCGNNYRNLKMEDIKEKCPDCEKGFIQKKRRKADNKIYYKCTSCKLTIGNKKNKYNLSIIQDLINVLKNSFEESDFSDIILPFIILKKLDLNLEHSKKEVLKKYKYYEGYFENLDILLNSISVDENDKPLGYYNFHENDLNYIITHSNDLKNDLKEYIYSFSDNVKNIFHDLDFEKQIIKLYKKNLLSSFIKNFLNKEYDFEFKLLIPSVLESIFEKIICNHSKLRVKEIGKYFIPNDVSNLMIKLLFARDKSNFEKKGLIKSIYDPFSSAGKLILNSKIYLKELNHSMEVVLYGQEPYKKLNTLCKTNVLLDYNNAENIKEDNLLSNDEFSDKKFDYIISNLSYLENNEANQLFVIENLISKMKEDEISRMVLLCDERTVRKYEKENNNSKIREIIIEKDYLEAIIKLPKKLFYDTNLERYIWILSNQKSINRKNRVKFIDMSKEGLNCQRAIGNKKNILSLNYATKRALHWFNTFEDTDNLRILNNEDIDCTDLGFEKLFGDKMDENKITKENASDKEELVLDNLIYPLINNYLTVTKGSLEKSLKVKNYFVLYEFLTAFNGIILLSALPKDAYDEYADEIFKGFKYGTMPWGLWMRLYRSLSDIYKREDFDLPFGLDFYRKLISKYFMNKLDGFIQLRNKKHGHGGASQIKREESLLSELDEGNNLLIQMFKNYLNYQLIYIDRVDGFDKNKNKYIIVKLNGRDACSPILYDEFSSREKLEEKSLYLFNPVNKELLKLKRNLIRFEFCKDCEKWSIYIYNSFKKNEAIYKSFQHEKHEFRDDLIGYEYIFK